MKKLIIFMQLLSLLLITVTASAADFNSGSTGADGAFNPTVNTEVQLPPDGVLNYTTVNISSGVTVTFKKNANNTPVYILATGNVAITGTIKLDGTSGSSIQPGKGGSGGFDGGFGGTQGVSGGKGVGPGGGNGGISNNAGGGGGFGTSGSTGSGGTTGGGTYGNSVLLPHIGGSGGGGASGTSESSAGAGGGGGGALLIASSATINVTGSITAIGGSGASGSGYCYVQGGGGGSGGAIKLIANTIAGNGTISAAGGSAGQVYNCPAWWYPAWGSSGGNGGSGRIRLEANTLNRTVGTTPTYTFGFPGPVFVANIPSLQITSIAGVNVPSNPTGSYATPDITFPSTTTNPVTVALSASNIPLGTTITVSIIPQFGSATDSVSSPLSGTLAASTAAASVTLANTYPYVITATATFTIQTAMYFDGEKIEKVRVASTMGKGSEVTYITETGKEIPAEKLMASLVR